MIMAIIFWVAYSASDIVFSVYWLDHHNDLVGNHFMSEKNLGSEH